MNTRPLERVHRRPVSRATEEEDINGKDGRRQKSRLTSWRVCPWRSFETLGERKRGRHPAAPRALSDQERDRPQQMRDQLTAIRGQLVGGCQLERQKISRQDTHYRETDGNQKHCRHPTPLRFLQLTRLAKDQGLWMVCAGKCGDSLTSFG